ncbi:MAG: hypothetical protein V4515_08280 [Chloroflexota bacterium]
MPVGESEEGTQAEAVVLPEAGALPEASDATTAADGMAAGGIVLSPAIPGSYLHPSAVHQAPIEVAVPTAVMPLAGTAAPAPDASTSPAGTSMLAAPARAGGFPAPRPGDAPLLADLPFDAPNSLAGWLVAVGSGVGALSFLLPWTPGIAVFTSSWGLSSVSNLPILGLLIVTAVLAILPNRVARWVRSGVLGLIGGALFLGLLWPYVVGDFGAEFGAVVGAAAAIVLMVGGTLSVAPERERPPAA